MKNFGFWRNLSQSRSWGNLKRFLCQDMVWISPTLWLKTRAMMSRDFWRRKFSEEWEKIFVCKESRTFFRDQEGWEEGAQDHWMKNGCGSLDHGTIYINAASFWGVHGGHSCKRLWCWLHFVFHGEASRQRHMPSEKSFSTSAYQFLKGSPGWLLLMVP